MDIFKSYKFLFVFISIVFVYNYVNCSDNEKSNDSIEQNSEQLNPTTPDHTSELTESNTNDPNENTTQSDTENTGESNEKSSDTSFPKEQMDKNDNIQDNVDQKDQIPMKQVSEDVIENEHVSNITIITADDFNGTNSTRNDQTKYKISIKEKIIFFSFKAEVKCLEVKYKNETVFNQENRKFWNKQIKALTFNHVTLTFWITFVDTQTIILNYHNSKWELIYTTPGVKQIIDINKRESTLNYLVIVNQIENKVTFEAKPNCLFNGIMDFHKVVWIPKNEQGYTVRVVVTNMSEITFVDLNEGKKEFVKRKNKWTDPNKSTKSIDFEEISKSLDKYKSTLSKKFGTFTSKAISMMKKEFEAQEPERIEAEIEEEDEPKPKPKPKPKPRPRRNVKKLTSEIEKSEDKPEPRPRPIPKPRLNLLTKSQDDKPSTDKKPSQGDEQKPLSEPEQGEDKSDSVKSGEDDKDNLDKDDRDKKDPGGDDGDKKPESGEDNNGIKLDIRRRISTDEINCVIETNVKTVTFTPKKQFLFSSIFDGELKIWSTDDSSNFALRVEVNDIGIGHHFVLVQFCDETERCFAQKIPYFTEKSTGLVQSRVSDAEHPLKIAILTQSDSDPEETDENNTKKYEIFKYSTDEITKFIEFIFKDDAKCVGIIFNEVKIWKFGLNTSQLYPPSHVLYDLINQKIYVASEDNVIFVYREQIPEEPEQVPSDKPDKPEDLEEKAEDEDSIDDEEAFDLNGILQSFEKYKNNLVKQFGTLTARIVGPKKRPKIPTEPEVVEAEIQSDDDDEKDNKSKKGGKSKKDN